MIKPSEEVVLPVGVEIDGTRYKKVTIHEMNGYDEENLTSRKVRNNGAKAQTLLLRRCIQEIEGLVPKKSNPNELIKTDIILKMTAPDRDYLFFCIRVLGGISQIDCVYECQSCSATNEEGISIQDLDVYEWPEEEPLQVPFTLMRGIHDEGKTYTEGIWKFLTGRQQEEIAKVGNDRVVNLSMRLCAHMTDMPTQPGEEQFKMMSMTERVDLLNQVGSESPGVQSSLEFTCSECDKVSEQSIDVSRFFTQAARTKTPNGKVTRRRRKRT